ncbi:MAG: hypothetical protein IPF56_09695 [Chloroflexi bacterium]|nr:hypothetical protein [Chloroflexota bacterium]
MPSLSSALNDTALKLVESVTAFVIFVVFGVTGALILSHQPRNTVGWLLMIEAALVFVAPLDTYFNNLTQAPTDLSPVSMVSLWIWGWLWLWYIFPILFIPLFFPTGKLLSPRWRWLVGLGLGLCLFFILFTAFMADFLNPNGTWTVPNPIGFLTDAAFPGGLWFILLISFAALCVVSLFVRYRRAQRVEREQIKWLLFASALFFAVYAINLVFNTYWLSRIRNFAILLLPIAIAIAILRYRLYDINVVIRKTLVYTVLTGFLALVYFGTVILLQQCVFRHRRAIPLIIVISTLVIAALFAPLRQRVQAVIDRRFFRKKYDAQQVLAQFAQTARDETDMAALQAELLRVVQETMQPEQASIWLKPTPPAVRTSFRPGHE